MELLSEAPTLDVFTPLAVHQSQTPESFFNSKPVLYYNSPGVRLSITPSDLNASSALSKLSDGGHARTNGSALNGNTQNHDADVSVEVDIWVTSEYSVYFPYEQYTINTFNRPDASSCSRNPRTTASQFPTHRYLSTPFSVHQIPLRSLFLCSYSLLPIILMIMILITPFHYPLPLQLLLILPLPFPL